MGDRDGVARTVAAAVAAMAMLAATACGSDDSGSGAPSPSDSPSATIEVPAASATTSTPGTSAPTTGPSDPASPATIVPEKPAMCDDELVEMLAVVDRSIADAQLDVGSVWMGASDAAVFDDRTHPADEFGHRMGLDCSVRLTQVTDDGGERMLLAAWTGDRRAWVIQATDAPEVPYRSDQRVQLFIDQPLGEWLVDQFVWAGSLDDGDTVIVGTVDTAFGVAAKSWWNEVPRFDDLEVTNGAERYAIDALVEAGNRNVSVGEPASVGVEIAAIQFITPLGLHLIATVAPPDWFDPTAPIVEGEMVVEQIGGVDVYVTAAVPGSYAVGSVGWVCGDHVWFVDASYGSVDELTAWTADLIESAGC